MTALVLLGAGVAGVVVAANGGEAPGPDHTSGSHGELIVVGSDHAPATLTIIEDFGCPACREFEDESRTTIAPYVAAGSVKIQYRLVASLNSSDSSSYSEQAMNAAACVLNFKPAAYPDFHDLLFTNQPESKSSSLPDTRLIDLAVQSGVQRNLVSKCIIQSQYSNWVKRVTNSARRAGVSELPMVQLNGNIIDSPSAETIGAAFAIAGLPVNP